jgi:hypothetical protein
MGSRVASGGLVWGAFPCRQGRVVHVDFEQGLRLTLERYQRLARALGVPLGELPLDLVSLPATYLTDPSGLREFARLCEGAALAIVDSLHAAHPGLEENEASVRQHLDILTRVSEQTGCAIDVIHHARKPAKDKGENDRYSIRGSGALYDAAQSVWVLGAEPGSPPVVSHEKARLTGTIREPIALQIRDVPEPLVVAAGGIDRLFNQDPRWGLSVSVVGASVVQAQLRDRSNEKLDRVVLRTVQELTVKHGQPPRSKSEVQRAIMGFRKADVFTSIDVLSGRGLLLVDGSGATGRVVVTAAGEEFLRGAA